jgi:aldose 1-epimerase
MAGRLAPGDGPGPDEAVPDARGPEPPAGREVRLRHHDQEAVVTEVGATLREYRVSGSPVIDGFARDELCPAARGQLLLPWPNRIGDGRYRFAGAEHQLPIDEPELGNAIHGLARWMGWTAGSTSEASVAMRLRLLARPGYPHCLDLEAGYRLGAEGLTVTVSAVNIGATPAPFAAGAHPYLTLGTPSIDAWRLRVPAATVLVTDSRSLPTGRTAVAGTAVDFRAAREIGATRLDHAFTDLTRDPDGLARVLLEAPGGRRLTLWCDPAYRWLQVFSGDALPAPAGRRSLAVEPMTGPPDAFRSGEDLIVLQPGDTFTAGWGIDVTGLPG